MGRYAFFSTGVEYKFWFAVQPSEDILKFGGTRLFSAKDHAMAYHCWDNPEEVWCKLLKHTTLPSAVIKEFVTGLKLADTPDGTDALMSALDKSPMLSRQESDAPFMLGLTIWHQLQYTRCLFVRYEM